MKRKEYREETKNKRLSNTPISICAIKKRADASDGLVNCDVANISSGRLEKERDCVVKRE
jgi:hypothetical protein